MLCVEQLCVIAISMSYSMGSGKCLRAFAAAAGNRYDLTARKPCCFNKLDRYLTRTQYCKFKQCARPPDVNIDQNDCNTAAEPCQYHDSISMQLKFKLVHGIIK